MVENALAIKLTAKEARKKRSETQYLLSESVAKVIGLSATSSLICSHMTILDLLTSTTTLSVINGYDTDTRKRNVTYQHILI